MSPLHNKKLIVLGLIYFYFVRKTKLVIFLMVNFLIFA